MKVHQIIFKITFYKISNLLEIIAKLFSRNVFSHKAPEGQNNSEERKAMIKCMGKARKNLRVTIERYMEVVLVVNRVDFIYQFSRRTTRKLETTACGLFFIAPVFCIFFNVSVINTVDYYDVF